MISLIIRWALHNRWAVVGVAFIVALLGAWSANRMAIDVLPDLNRPTVVILAEAHELTPEQTALQIALPIERAMGGLPGAERVSSQTGKGMTVIKVEFAWGSDIYRNRQIVTEKLQEVRPQIKQEVNINIAPISSIMGQIQLIGLTSKSGNTSQEDLRLLADTDLKYDLLLPGVAKIIVTGGSPKQLQVIVDQNKLLAYNLTLSDVEKAIADATQSKSGGFLNIGAQAPMVVVDGYLKDANELALAKVTMINDRPIVISDIAEVRFGPATIKTGEAGVNGKPGVILVVMKQPGADTMTLTEALGKVLADKSVAYGEDVEICTDLFSQRAFIQRALDNLRDAVRDGALLVILILFIFLMNWRTTLITLTAIPISIAITSIVFALFGFSINTMTLGGLAVGIGSLVDSAIVDVENCFRRLRLNAQKPKEQQEAPLEVIYHASVEVRGAVIMATVLVVIVYIPLFFLTGMEGRLFVPIGISYIISMCSSLLVAMTLTVSLCAILLPGHVGDENAKDTALVRVLKGITEKLIRFSVKNTILVITTFAVLVIWSIYALITAGKEFLPAFNEGVAQVNLVLPPEAGLELSSEISSQAEKLLMQIDGVKTLSRRTGRAEEDEHAHGVNASDMIISFDDKMTRTREEIIDDVRDVLEKNFPGVLVAVEQPMAHLISAMLSGVEATVAIKIYGPDFPHLKKIAEEIKHTLEPIPGIKDLQIEQQQLTPIVDIVPDRKKLAALGLTIADVNELIDLALGEDATTVHYEGRNSFPVVIRLQEDQRLTLKHLEQLVLKNEKGEIVRLTEVAEIRVGATINNIRHENNKRLLNVKHNISGRPLGDVVADIEKALAPLQERLKSDKNYEVKISGQYEAQQTAEKYIFWLSFVSLALMIFVLFSHFKSWSLTLQSLLSIPMSLVGAMIFLVATKQTISISTLVGLISMVGIAASNAILLLDHYEHLMTQEHMPYGIELLVRAGKERMTPVLMTALTSGIALIPLVFNPGAPGKEILYPVASVIIGGLVSCTFLDFTVRPALYHLLHKK